LSKRPGLKAHDGGEPRVVAVVDRVPQGVAQAVEDERRAVLVEIAVAAFLKTWTPVVGTQRPCAVGAGTGVFH